MIFALGASVAGEALYAAYIGDYLAAVALGIAFQYFAIALMRGMGLRKSLLEAAKGEEGRHALARWQLAAAGSGGWRGGTDPTMTPPSLAWTMLDAVAMIRDGTQRFC